MLTIYYVDICVRVCRYLEAQKKNLKYFSMERNYDADDTNENFFNYKKT